MKKVVLISFCIMIIMGFSGCGFKQILDRNPQVDYDTLNPDSDLLPVKDAKGKYGYIDYHGNIVIQPQFDSAHDFSDGLARVYFSNQWGYIDKTGQIVIKPKYELLGDFYNGYAECLSADHKFIYIDKSGNEALPPSDWVSPYDRFNTKTEGSETTISLSPKFDPDTDLVGYVNTNGLFEIQPQYAQAMDFQNDMAAVQDKSTGMWGFIDGSGELVIPFKFYSTEGFFDGIAIVNTSEDLQTAAVIDKTGKRLFDEMVTGGYCGEGIHWVTDFNRLTFFDNSGKVRFALEGDCAGTFSEGLCPVSKPYYGETESYQQYGYINISGDLVIGYSFHHADSFHNGVARVQLTEDPDGKFGYINLKGEYIWNPEGKPGTASVAASPAATAATTDTIPLDADADLLVVKNEQGKYGFINHAGEIVIQLKYSWASPFSEGLARVDLGNTHGYINESDEMVIQLPVGSTSAAEKYGLEDFHFGKAFFADENKMLWGVVNKQGIVETEPVYASILEFSEGLAAVQDGTGRWGYLDADYNMVIKPTYFFAHSFHENLASVQDDKTSKFGFIDKQGNVVIPFQLNNAEDFSGGIAAIATANGWGYMNNKGRITVEPQYETVNSSVGGVGVAYVGEYQQKTIYNKQGKPVAQDVLNGGYCGDGLLWWNDNHGNIHFANEDGDEEFSLRADEVGTFSEGLCAIGQYNWGSDSPQRVQYGYIDRKGNLIIKHKYTYAWPFKNGVAKVEMGEFTGEKFGYINKKGEVIWDPR